MFESFGFENLTAPQAAIWFGLALGVAFGVMAEISKFCFRRAVAGSPSERKPALAVWLSGLITAVIGVQLAVASGVISFAEHRFFAADMPVVSIVVGGLLFGAGMVLTRGCASRLTVLAGSGNLRAALVLVVFAIAAHAAMKGVLAPLRNALSQITLPLGELTGLGALPGGASAWSALIVLSAAVFVARSKVAPRHLLLGAGIGVLAALGWVGTGFILYDDFDPIAFESLAFTAPSADTLFWGVAATSIPAKFGTGLIGGVLAGALIASSLGGRFQWQSFESPAQTGRYMAGAMLMGVGGVLAGGCTVGAGLSGVPTLSFAALLALASITLGGSVAARALSESSVGSAEPSSTPPTPQAV